MIQISIAVDGPTSSGESTVAKILAKELSYIYTDTGTVYHTVTYLAITNSVSFSDGEGLISLIKKYPISFPQQEDRQHVFIASRDVTLEVHQPDVIKAVSEVSAHGKVKEELVAVQRKIGEHGGIIMDGRDIGTAVSPNAEVKIFLVASVNERAKKHFKENQEKGIPTDLETPMKEIQEGDHYDSTRDASPLKRVEDTVRVGTVGESIPEAVAAIETAVLEEGYLLF